MHRDAHQRARRVERATAFLELQRRALALRDRVGSRRIERAAVALALLEELQVVCECEDVSWGCCVPGKWWWSSFGGGGVSADTPAPQTLMVLSLEPDTILVPSLLKPTEVIPQSGLWAFAFSAIKARDEASAKEEETTRCRMVGKCKKRERTPDFDGPVVRAGHDL